MNDQCAQKREGERKRERENRKPEYTTVVDSGVIEVDRRSIDRQYWDRPIRDREEREACDRVTLRRDGG